MFFDVNFKFYIFICFFGRTIIVRKGFEKKKLVGYFIFDITFFIIFPIRQFIYPLLTKNLEE